MNALATSVLVALVLIVLFSPRRWALLAMMAGALYLAQGSIVELMGINLNAMRVLELAGFVRIIVRREFTSLSVNGVDRAFIFAYSYTTAVFLLRSSLGYGSSLDVSQVGHMDRIGSLVDAGLCYVVFRTLIRCMDDLVLFLKDLVLLLIPFVALLFVERETRQNPFALVGGMTAFYDPTRLRCVGSFGHPSLLGTFGASFLPLYIGLALTQRCRTAAIAGIGLCVAVVLFSNSGGPAGFAAITLIAWLLWIVRTRMVFVRWAIIISLVLVGLFMEAPLWYLPGKLSLIVGGDGWHRSRFMEVAFGDISNWWLAGMPLDLTRHWFPHLVGGAGDITNLYIKFGLDAGILAMLLLVLLLVRAFRMLGRSLAAVRLTSGSATDDEVLLWGLGAMLVGHVFNWFAITYFDQTQMVWFMQCAAIASITQAYTDTIASGSRSSMLLSAPLERVMDGRRVDDKAVPDRRGRRSAPAHRALGRTKTRQR